MAKIMVVAQAEEAVHATELVHGRAVVLENGDL